jgi:hypothetical protein
MKRASEVPDDSEQGRVKENARTAAAARGVAHNLSLYGAGRAEKPQEGTVTRPMKVIVILLLVVALLYSYATRVGRYAIVTLDRASFFVIHDTSSGEYWLMRGEVSYPPGSVKLTHSVEEHWEGFSLFDRLRPR